jgi:hypothetical protein
MALITSNTSKLVSHGESPHIVSEKASATNSSTVSEPYIDTLNLLFLKMSRILLSFLSEYHSSASRR